MRIDVRGNDNGNQMSGAKVRHETVLGSVVDGKWYYYRWWMKIADGFDWNGHGGAKAHRVKRTDNSMPPKLWTGFVSHRGFFLHELEEDDVSGLYFEDPGDGVPCVNYDMDQMADSEWHEYIVAMKMQTGPDNSDAILRVWIDGVPVGEALRLRITRETESCNACWGTWMLCPHFAINEVVAEGQLPACGGTIWLDDFSMDNGWNSLLYPEPQ